MKKILLVSICFVFYQTITFCQSNVKPESIVYSLKGESNFKTIVYNLHDSIKHVREFDKETGSLVLEYTRINNKYHGVFCRYYPDGTMKSIITYDNEVPVGAFITFYPSGAMMSYYNYGYSERDKDIEQVIERGEFEEDYPPYSVVEWARVYYKKLNGPYYYYYENGKTERIECYSENLSDGIWQYFDEEGKLIKEETYVNDELIDTLLYE